MRKALSLILAGLGATAIGGAAVAASRDSHVMNVPLPDGSARVEYVGEVAPKVTFLPAVAAPFSIFDRSMFDMDRQIGAMMRRVDALARAPAAMGSMPGMNVAAYGDVPAGSQSVTVVSTTNGNKTCARTTEETSQGAGKPPKIVSNVSGDCGPAAAPGPAPLKPRT